MKETIDELMKEVLILKGQVQESLKERNYNGMETLGILTIALLFGIIVGMIISPKGGCSCGCAGGCSCVENEEA